jgi:phasin family protein
MASDAVSDKVPAAEPQTAPAGEKVGETAAKAAVSDAETAVATVRTAEKAPPKRKTAKAKSTRKAAAPRRAATAPAGKKAARAPSVKTKKSPERKIAMATKQNPTDTMKAQAEAAMSQSKAAFEDMSTKSKEMMEKNVKTMEELGGFARGNVEALVEAGKIYAEGAQTLAKDAAGFAKKQAEETAAAVQSMSSVKNPNEVVELQGKYVRGQFDALVAHSSAMTEQMLKLTGDVMAPFQNRMASAMEKFTKTA